MPIYEFKCKNCNHVFEELVFSSADNSEIECPNCGTVNADKLMSAFSASGTASSGNCGPSGFS